MYAEEYDLCHCLLVTFLVYFKDQPYENYLDHVFDLTTVTEEKDNTEGSDNEIDIPTETKSTPEIERPDGKQKATNNQVDKTSIPE